MIWVIFLLCFGLAKCNCTNQICDKLIFTQVLLRHGDRSIITTYPNDPYKKKSHWPDGIGQLTNLGKQQAYRLGQFLRRRYRTFLGSYSPDKISTLSSDFDRTINSANLVLAALFPPKDNHIWNKDLLWQSIAVHSISQKIDYLIGEDVACSRYQKALTQYEDSSKIRALIKQNRELFEYLEENCGQPVRKLNQLRDIFETLSVERRFNKILPEWTRTVFMPGSTFEKLSIFWSTVHTGTTELKRLKSGFLLKVILDRFRNKTLSLLPDQLMQIYSGHDSTIEGILNSLAVFEPHIPPYSSCILFELYDSGDSHYVQLFYRNTTVEMLRPLNIPNCGTKCTLNRFYELYREILPSDFETECSIEWCVNCNMLTKEFRYFILWIIDHLKNFNIFR